MTEAHLIATHIARHGVTQCPAAIVALSSARLTAADVAWHQARVPMAMKAQRTPWQPEDHKRRGNRR